VNHEPRRPGRLPEDPAYWEELARRAIAAALGGPSVGASASVGGGGGGETWWTRVADSALVLAAAAVVAVLGGTFLMGERPSPAVPAGSSAIVSALAPEDPMLRSLLVPAGPPPASALVSLVALREGER